jgi:hypothetical protein
MQVPIGTINADAWEAEMFEAGRICASGTITAKTSSFTIETLSWEQYHWINFGDDCE